MKIKGLLNLQIVKSSNLQILKSSNLQIFKSSNLQILKSSNLQIVKSSNPITISNFEDLEIWQKAREMARLIRKLTRKHEFNKDLRFCGQCNSAAGSIMDNIAEGFERDGHKELIQFLYIAKGSNAECRSQSYRALNAGFITIDEHQDILNKTKSLKNKILSLIKYLKANNQRGSKYM